MDLLGSDDTLNLVLAHASVKTLFACAPVCRDMRLAVANHMAIRTHFSFRTVPSTLLDGEPAYDGWHNPDAATSKAVLTMHNPAAVISMDLAGAEALPPDLDGRVFFPRFLQGLSDVAVEFEWLAIHELRELSCHLPPSPKDIAFMSNLTKIAMSKCPRWTPLGEPGNDVVLALAEHCPQLESLHWEEADNLNEPFAISAATFGRLLRGCKSLHFIRWLSAGQGMITTLAQCETTRQDLEVWMTGDGSEFDELQDIVLATLKRDGPGFCGKLFINSFANPFQSTEDEVGQINDDAQEICAMANGSSGRFHLEYELDTFG